MRLYIISYKPIPPARVIIAGQMDPGGSFNRRWRAAGAVVKRVECYRQEALFGRISSDSWKVGKVGSIRLICAFILQKWMVYSVAMKRTLSTWKCPIPSPVHSRHPC